jgi:hypothetical protein
MTNIDKDIDLIRTEGKEPVLLLGVNAMKNLYNSQKILRRPGTIATYRGVTVVLNACNPDKCEVVVKE